jgi:hypothetical protein
MLDRREKAREFFLSGWDPYIISLAAETRAARAEAGEPVCDERVAKASPEPGPESHGSEKPAVTSRRATLLNRLK